MGQFSTFRQVLVSVTSCVLLTAVLADAQEPARPSPRFRGGMNFARGLCDVEGLWGFATFEAKLDAAALEKLRAVCQTAYDTRAKEIESLAGGDPRQGMEKVKALGDTMVADAQKALGENASKIEPWVTRRNDMLASRNQMMQRREGGPRGPQPGPGAPALQGPAAAPTPPTPPPATAAPTAPSAQEPTLSPKEKKKE